MTIYTSFPCTIVSGKEKEELDINEHLNIENDETPIFIYPKNGNISPFKIDTENQSPNYRVIKKDDKILVFLLDGILVENKTCHNFNYNGVKSSIEVGSQSILFSGVKNKKLIHLSSKIDDIKIGSFNFIDYISFSSDDKNVIIAYNPKKNSIKTFTADKIEIEKDGFSLYKKSFNYEEIKEEYFVDKDGLKVKNKSFKMIETQSFPSEMIVCKFMNAVKCEDWDGGLSFLDKALSRKLNSSSLKQYMGDISYFYMLDTCLCFAISNGKNKIYEFMVKDNKISDINDN